MGNFCFFQVKDKNIVTFIDQIHELGLVFGTNVSEYGVAIDHRPKPCNNPAQVQRFDISNISKAYDHRFCNFLIWKK